MYSVIMGIHQNFLDDIFLQIFNLSHSEEFFNQSESLFLSFIHDILNHSSSQQSLKQQHSIIMFFFSSGSLGSLLHIRVIRQFWVLIEERSRGSFLHFWQWIFSHFCHIDCLFLVKSVNLVLGFLEQFFELIFQAGVLLVYFLFYILYINVLGENRRF